MNTKSKSAVRRMQEIDGCRVECFPAGVLVVTPPNGAIISVLPVGTHDALNILGMNTKKKIVRWWKEQR